MARLYQRGSVYYSNFTQNGRRIRVALDSDKHVAQIKLNRMLEFRQAHRFGRVVPDLSWPEFRMKFLKFSEGEKARQTYLRDEASIKSLEKFRRISAPQEITTSLLDEFKHSRKAAKKGPATINRELKSIKAMMRKASEWGVISKDAIPQTKLYREGDGKLIFYSPAQLGKLLAKCKGQWKTMCLLGSRAGLRRSEMYFLSWSDVDLGRKIISVTPKDGFMPKGGRSRHIPIPTDLESHLRGLARASEWVLAERKNLSLISTMFRKIVKSAGLTGGLHSLRHTYASHLVQAGVPLYSVSKLLGHSTVEMSARYSHLAPETLAEAVKHLPNL